MVVSMIDLLGGHYVDPVYRLHGNRPRSTCNPDLRSVRPRTSAAGTARRPIAKAKNRGDIMSVRAGWHTSAEAKSYVRAGRLRNRDAAQA
jgi:hypothetical protein